MFKKELVLARGKRLAGEMSESRQRPPTVTSRPIWWGGMEGFRDETRRITSLYSCRYLPARRCRRLSCRPRMRNEMKVRAKSFRRRRGFTGDTRRDRDETSICQRCDEAAAESILALWEPVYIATKCDVLEPAPTLQLDFAFSMSVYNADKKLSYPQRKCASNVAILYGADGISI